MPFFIFFLDVKCTSKSFPSRHVVRVKQAELFPLFSDYLNLRRVNKSVSKPVLILPLIYIYNKIKDKRKISSLLVSISKNIYNAKIPHTFVHLIVQLDLLINARYVDCYCTCLVNTELSIQREMIINVPNKSQSLFSHIFRRRLSRISPLRPNLYDK